MITGITVHLTVFHGYNEHIIYLTHVTNLNVKLDNTAQHSETKRSGIRIARAWAKPRFQFDGPQVESKRCENRGTEGAEGCEVWGVGVGRGASEFWEAAVSPGNFFEFLCQNGEISCILDCN